MNQEQKNRILKWNLERNGLKFDPKLEIMMLSEEIQEFFQAKTLAHKLQEYSDFLFVWEGTRFKYYNESYTIVECLTSGYRKWKDLYDWQFEVRRAMKDSINLPNQSEHIFDVALSAVIAANEAKTTEKDVRGKIIKGDNYVSPLGVIEEYLKGNYYA